MMKGRSYATVAVRRNTGQIVVRERKLKSSFSAWMTQLPFARGFFLLWDMLGIGLWALNVSQNIYLEDRGEKQESRESASERALVIVSIVVSFAIAIGVFKLLPTFLVDTVNWWLVPINKAGWNNILEGVFKFGIFVGYVAAIGLIPEVRRVFMYHGAEHAAINAFEENPKRDDAEWAATHSRLHPRCGTSFIAFLIVISVVTYYFLDTWLLKLGVPAISGWPIWWIRWPARILAIPLLAGISYELLKLTFFLRRIWLFRPLAYFGMLFQILTTRRPSPDQVEVAIAALRRVRALTEDDASRPQAESASGDSGASSNHGTPI
ncbi:MAG: hypothetical protein B1H03_00395 [Planctomycetales bacterium 4484_113]|nr:MAG: hypothetical protein B1H03_00395 [Planctomycetales bacterium 4484_113]